MFTADIISVFYSQDRAPTLENVSFRLDNGQVVLLTGSTGSGKTTLLRCINGLIPGVISADIQGEICWRGKPHLEAKKNGGSPRIVTVLQNPFHAFAAPLMNGRNAWKSTKHNDLGSLSYYDLSAGQRQKILLERAFRAQPDILLLDEPTAHLDETGCEALCRMLEERGSSGEGVTIIAEHRYSGLKKLGVLEIELDSEPEEDCSSAFSPMFFPSESERKTLVEIKNVSAKPGERRLFREINFSIQQGESIGLTGDNGCGKTTLGRILVKHRRPDEGRVLFPAPGLKTAFIGEDPSSQLLCDSVKAEISFAADNYGINGGLTEELGRCFSLKEIWNKSPFLLSHGQQMRVAVAAGLSHDPDLVVFDEPFQGQDAFGRRRMKLLLENLKNSGRGVLVISCDRDFLRRTVGKIFKLREGKLEPVN